MQIDGGVASPTAAGDGAIEQYSAVIKYQTRCLKLLFEEAYRNRAYGCQLTPDCIFSDGMVATMLLCTAAGYQLVMAPSLRQREETVLEQLARLGYLDAAAPASRTGKPLAIPQRVVAELFALHLHPEMSVFEYGHPKPTRPFVFPFCYWRVPGNRGIILHEFFGSPVVMDFTALRPEHAECLEHDDYENVYLGQNFFRDGKKAYFVQDSDEFCILSLTPVAANFAAPGNPAARPAWRQAYAQLCNMRESMNHYVARQWEPVRRDLFRASFRLHSKDIDDVWRREEKRIDRLIALAVGDYFCADRTPAGGIRSFLFETATRKAALAWLGHKATLPRHFFDVLKLILRRAFLALSGDAATWRWIGWRLRKLAAVITGRPFQEPRPPSPE
jgi:hypothetical protein